MLPNTTQEWMLKRISDGQFPTPGGHWPMPGVTKTPPFFELILGVMGDKYCGDMFSLSLCSYFAGILTEVGDH